MGHTGRVSSSSVTSRPGGLEIRPYRPSDREAVYEICVRTADAGGDARGQYSTDDLMPDLFAGPYLHLEPELALVLATGPEQGGRAVGYILGTADTATFVRRYREIWIPLVADRYPPSAPGRSRAEQGLLDGHHRPEARLRPELAGYPAHLHIDILPEHQGGGHGRALMLAWLATAARAGAERVFLEMDPANTGARAFYDRLGFRALEVRDAWGVHLVRSTGDTEPVDDGPASPASPGGTGGREGTGGPAA